MKVLCTLPNAALNISGVGFEPHPEGVVSVEDLEPKVAEIFLAVPGYRDAGVEVEREDAREDARVNASPKKAVARKTA
jgi:hypothetical protein